MRLSFLENSSSSFDIEGDVVPASILGTRFWNMNCSCSLRMEVADKPPSRQPPNATQAAKPNLPQNYISVRSAQLLT